MNLKVDYSQRINSGFILYWCKDSLYINYNFAKIDLIKAYDEGEDVFEYLDKLKELYYNRAWEIDEAEDELINRYYYNKKSGGMNY